MIKNAEGQWVESPVHGFFGLSRSNYFVAPRTALEAMPLEWQERFVALMEEAFNVYGLETPEYHVLRDSPAYTWKVLEDPDDEDSRIREYISISDDEWANYRHPDPSLLPKKLWPEWYVKKQAENEEED